MKSVQFEGVGKTYNVRDIVGTFQGVPYDDDSNFAATAPCLMVRTEAGVYDTYYYLSDGVWDDSISDYGPGWCDQSGNELAPEAGDIEPGTAIWFIDQNGESSSLTIAGGIIEDASATVSFGLGYTLAALPYPKGVSFNEITFTNLVGVPYDDDSNFASTAPCMMVRTNDGVYDTYYYLSDGVWSDSVGDYVPGWCDQGGSELPSYDNIAITSGTAFWVYLPDGSTPFSATFTL